MICHLWNILAIETNDHQSMVNIVIIEDVKELPILKILHVLEFVELQSLKMKVIESLMIIF